MIPRRDSILGGLVMAGAAAAIVFAACAEDRPAIPDPTLTPGAVATIDRAEICLSDGRGGSAYSRAHRSALDPARKARISALYGARKGELDHLIPLCAGGADTDANLWVQPWDEAREKDRLEAEACRRICAGRVSVAEAQAWFAPDWRIAYMRVFGKVP